MSFGLRALIVPLFIGLLLPLGTSCSPFSSSPPPIPDSTFSRILVELHVLSARGRQESPVPVQVRDSILHHYGVDSSDFEQTLGYYSRRPEDFASLYNTVIDSLNALRSMLQKQAVPSRTRDSVRRSTPSLQR